MESEDMFLESSSQWEKDNLCHKEAFEGQKREADPKPPDEAVWVLKATIHLAGVPKPSTIPQNTSQALTYDFTDAWVRKLPLDFPRPVVLKVQFLGKQHQYSLGTW